MKAKVVRPFSLVTAMCSLCFEAGQNCENSAACSTYPLWQGLDETVRNYLAGFTLVDVLHMKK